jgi:hypothetical protein
MKMNKKTKATFEKNRKETSIKSMYFNRYLLVRYASALFFFSNLYWFFYLITSRSWTFVIPLLMIIIILISVAEQVKMYGNHSNNAKYTFYCFRILTGVNLLIIPIVLFTPMFEQLYPFMINQYASRLLIICVLAVGILISGFILFRLNNIRQDKDWHYKRLKKFENAMN